MGKKKANKLVVNLSDDENENEINKTENIENNGNADEKEDTTTNNNNSNNIDNDDDDEGSEEGEKVETKGKMVQRHKMEIKKLQQQIDKLNHAIPKKDKKAKSDLLEKTKKMEDDLKKKHQQELEQFEQLNKTTQSIEELNLEQQQQQQQQKQPSKAYLKKAQKLKQEEERMKQLEEDRKNYVSKGVIEMNDFLAKLKPLNKTVKFISPDGDCLYQAITNQLLINKDINEEESKTYAKKLRTIASDYIKNNRDEFLPFIISEDEYSTAEDPIQEYCQEQVLTIGKWGGHIELKALSQSLKKVITIFNAYSNDIVIGEEFTSPIYLSYHRHAFTLGEHYNSVIPISN